MCDIFLYVSITIYLVCRFLEYTVFSVSEFTESAKMISYIIMLLCISIRIIINFRSDKKKNIFFIFLFLFFFIFSIFFDASTGVACIGFAFCVDKYNNKPLFKYLLFLFILLLSCGILGGFFKFNSFSREFGDTRERCAFSFEHPYVIQSMWFSIMSLIIYLKEKFTVKEMFILGSITLIFYMLCGTRASLISSFLLLFLYYILEKKPSSNLNYIFKYIYWLCFLLSTILVFLYTFNKAKFILLPLDNIFSGRISMASRFYVGVCQEKIPILPIDQNIIDLEVLWNEYALKSLILDSEYSDLLFKFGLIYSSVTIFIMNKFTLMACKQGKKIYIILGVSAINALMQQSILTIFFNPIILLIFSTIFDNKSENKKRIKYEAIFKNN